MRNTIWKYFVRGTLCALVLSIASPALALDPRPKTYRGKQKHDLRDAQLGLSHPTPEGSSISLKSILARSEQASPRRHYPMPKSSSYRAKQRHMFRDVQLGFGAPVPSYVDAVNPTDEGGQRKVKRQHMPGAISTKSH